MRLTLEILGSLALMASSLVFAIVMAVWGPFAPLLYVFGGVSALSVLLLNWGGPDRRLWLERYLWAGLAGNALGLVGALARFPIDHGGFDAHGFGATGGEGNLMLGSWLHLAFLLGAAALGRRRGGEA